MYNYRYINKHNQFDQISFTLILEDLTCDPIKTIRIEKNFIIEEKDLNDEFLYQEAKKEIIRINNEELNSVEQVEE